jgi:hypothetical protein
MTEDGGRETEAEKGGEPGLRLRGLDHRKSRGDAPAGEGFG